MKKNIIFHFITISLLVLFVVACSRKEDKFINRTWHAMTTKYNTLYNGGVAFDEGRQELIDQYEDNYWKQLPIERLEIRDELYLEKENGNERFLRAEEKAAKAIQRHSMNIKGREKNPQIDEAFMLLGRARYFDQRFVPALEAFNYILSNYPTSNSINYAVIWKAKTFIRLENEEAAIKGLKAILPKFQKDIDLSKEERNFIGGEEKNKKINVFNKKGEVKDKLHESLNISKGELSSAAAMLAQAYVNLKHKDSAIAPMRVAVEYTQNNEEKGRYHYILGQLYNRVRERDSANIEFDKIIKLNRRTPREYLINAYLAKARNLEIESSDQIAYLDILNKLEKNWENRKFLDKIYYEKAIFFFGNDSLDVAETYYKKSLDTKGNDAYLNSLSHETLSRINFNRADYEIAGKYMDSALSLLDLNSKRYRVINKKRKSLEDVLKYETIVKVNDSVLRIAKLPKTEQLEYYTKYTDSIKELKRQQLKKQKAKKALLLQEAGIFDENAFQAKSNKEDEADFYFYNPITVANGKLKFERVFGKRERVDFWKVSSIVSFSVSEEVEEIIEEDYNIDEDPLFDPKLYVDKIPSEKKVLDSVAKQLNEAYFELGTIYKEKLKEYDRASEKFESLLLNNPDDKYVMPVKYNLFKIYQSNGNTFREDKLRKDILKNHPNSRYAEIVKNPNDGSEQILSDVDKEYANIYKLYENQNYTRVLTRIDAQVAKLQGDPIASKFLLLKAYALGKVYGVHKMRELLNFIALTYPQSEEGRKSIDLQSNTLPYLEQLTFESDTTSGKKYKLIYDYNEEKRQEANKIKAELDTLIKKRNFNYLSTSLDFYTKDTIFVIVHGLEEKGQAHGLNNLITDDENDWYFDREGVVISSPNYKVIQLNKKYQYYLKNRDSINHK